MRTEQDQILRIIDANLNRLGEGLRLLEELARLILDDAELTQRLKNMRHELLRSDVSFQQSLLQARDSESDVGVDMVVPGEEARRELPTLLVANARRVQESLRVLEELARLPDISPVPDSMRFKQARFALYTIEQELMSRLLRRERQKCISGVYVILDTEALRGRPHLEVAPQVIRGGARVIQLRDKSQSKQKLLPIARELRKLCAGHGVLFLVNDYLDIALASDADGVHLGQDDLPIEAARKLLPPGKILGCSITTVELALAAQSRGADYIALGAIYPTESKTSTTTPAKVVGLETLHQVRQAVTLPLVAIGGINQANVAEVIAVGADSVAVIGAVLAAASPEEATRELATVFETER